MINGDDISEAVVARYAATLAFTMNVPGGGWYGRGPDTPSGYPYAVHTVEAGAAKFQTDGSYVQTFTVKVAAYAPIGASGVNVQDAAQALVTALCTTAAQTAFQAASLRNAGDKILQARGVTPTGEFAPELREARDVFLCGVQVELLCQGTSGAA